MQTTQAAHRQPEPIARRQFSTATALALLVAAAIAIGCGGDSKSPTSPTSAAPSQGSGIRGTVGANHPIPHVALITTAQLSAGAGVTIDISNGLHSHTVTFTAVQVGQIAARARVSMASSTDPHSDGTGAHQHMVTFN